GRIACAETYKIAEGRNVLQPHALKTLGYLLHTGLVQGIAAGDKGLVLQGSNGSSLGNTVDIERLSYTIHDIGYRGVCHPVSDTQAGQSIRLGKSARNDEIIELGQPVHAFGF